MKVNFKNWWELIKKTFKNFQEDDPMSYSAIIGFYTIFSLPAVLIIIVRIAAIAFGQEAVTGELYFQMKNLMGPESAAEIQNIIKNTYTNESGMVASIVGIATLAFSATTVFISLQNALNAIWGVKPKPEKGWLKLIINRVLSFAMVVTFGFLMMVSLTLDTVVGILNNMISTIFSDFTEIFLIILNVSISLAVVCIIFAVIFKVLPDAKILWRDVWAGAIATTILFTIGKYLIGFYLGNSDMTTSYGAAGSLVLILIWVYYSSLIILVGAEFTQVLTQSKGRQIEPSDHAVRIVTKEIEKDGSDSKVVTKDKLTTGEQVKKERK